ncbi:hypothetical protein GYMLUDRAFT_253275 [Collybiopsis luxurians FD-317 M1]|uniref:Uncharacterized protein n=1 Tax=Collybiopsis luxurians FD-317 M1 TaxID=944289 RepID=A0A0D0BKY6_9AGAR|nr:hypothetical protein GYMLUDRAFT_253275 [Collybiopsis luxurians FD-317 M1]
MPSVPSLLSSLTSTFHNPSNRWNDAILHWRLNPYDFLMEGAKAVREFAKPLAKVVGKVLDVQFHIKVKLTLLVRAEDKLSVQGVAEAEEEEDKDKSGPAMEVYIPISASEVAGSSRTKMGDMQTVTEDLDDRNIPALLSSLDLSGSSTPTITDSGLHWAEFTGQVHVLDIDVRLGPGSDLVLM